MTTTSEPTNSELITLPPADTSGANLPSIPAHFTAPALEAFYKQVEAEVTSEVPDVETPEGRANIKALAAKVASSKTANTATTAMRSTCAPRDVMTPASPCAASRWSKPWPPSSWPTPCSGTGRRWVETDLKQRQLQIRFGDPI